MNEAAAAHRLDHLIWGIVAIVAAIILAAPLVSTFIIEWVDVRGASRRLPRARRGGVLLHARAAGSAAGVGLPEHRTSDRIRGSGRPALLSPAAADLPLNDRAYDAIDRALGLDWKAMLDVMNAWPLLFDALRPIYLSLTLQMTTAVLCLAFTGRFVWLRVYTLAFIFAALITIATSAVLPAAGVWPSTD